MVCSASTCSELPVPVVPQATACLAAIFPTPSTNAATLQLLREIQLPHRFFALAIDDVGGRLYVGHTQNSCEA